MSKTKDPPKDDRDKTKPPQPHRPATGCHSAGFFDRLRRSPRVNPSLEEALVGHLAAPCRSCLGRLATLSPLGGDNGGPRDLLPPSDQALIRALRTLGGRPARRWLQVERRRAVDAVTGPFGFLWLVIEEARQIVGFGLGLELRRWAAVALGPVYNRKPWRDDRHPSRPLAARALLYVAASEHRRGKPAAALDLFDRAAALADHFPEDTYLAALVAETYGQLTGDRRATFSRGQYKLGLSRLIRKGDGPRRAEILLRQARDELRREEFGLALALADEAVDQLDDRHSPLVERSAHHVRALAALAEAEAAPLGVPRVVAAARFAANLAMLSPIPAIVDGELSREYVRLSWQLEDLWDQHRFYWTDCEMPADLQPEDEAMACVVMVAACERGRLLHSDRLFGLSRAPAIAEKLGAQRAEVERWAEALRMVRGFPELLRPIAKVLKWLEAEGAKP